MQAVFQAAEPEAVAQQYPQQHGDGPELVGRGRRQPRNRNENKSVFLGVVLACLFFLTGADMLAYLISTRENESRVLRWAAGTAMITLLLSGAALYRWPIDYATGGALPTAREIAAHHNLLDFITQEVQRGHGQRRVFFTQVSPYLNATVLQYRLGVGRSGTVDAVDRHLSGDLAAAEAELTRADFVVAFSEGNPAVLHHLPGGALQPRLLDQLAANGGHLLASTRGTPAGGELFLYARNTGFHGVRALDGLATAEGPYSEQGLPRVRWGVGPTTRLELEVPAPGGGRLVVEARADFGGQTMRVSVDGRRLTEVGFVTPGTFERFHIELDLEPGHHELETAHSHWHEPSVTDDRQRAVLFRTILVLPS